MEFTDLLTIATTIILSLFGGGGIVVVFSNWIGKILADRYVEKLKQEIQQEIESYKTKLKKSEFLFQKEFEAATEFISIRRELMPKYRMPDMDWDDACEDFCQIFDKASERLEDYLGTHGAALKAPVLAQLSVAISQCQEGQFENPEIGNGAKKTAGEVMSVLEEVEVDLRDAVWSQSSM